MLHRRGQGPNTREMLLRSRRGKTGRSRGTNAAPGAMTVGLTNEFAGVGIFLIFR
jgi:hypothetical protein